jgi:hypothetical protein
MAKHEYCGECIFCNSKCPGCGSLNVSVRFIVTFQYDNETANSINIDQDFDEIELDCNDCGESFHDDGFERDERLDALNRTLGRALELPDELEAEWKDGVVTYTPYITKTLERGEAWQK